MTTSQRLSQFCIYTILHQQKLASFFRSGGEGEAEENTAWKTGERLFLQAKKSGMRMPILFSAADIGGGLIYYGILQDIKIGKDNSSTLYKFTELTKIENSPPISSLELKSKRRPLSNSYQRPYAICYTPSFLRE